MKDPQPSSAKNHAGQDDPLAALLAGKAKLVVQPGGDCGSRQLRERLPDRVVLPGAFNPLHEGHRRMASIAGEKTGKAVVFEISVKNVDKPTLNREELEQRSQQFAALDLCLTAAPTFLQKSLLFPAATFLVGADTVARIAERRYYSADDPFQQLADRECRFLVYGRVLEQRFVTLRDLALPSDLLAICTELTEADFRMDISSSEIRRSR